MTVDSGSVPEISRRSALSQRMGVGWSRLSSNLLAALERILGRVHRQLRRHPGRRRALRQPQVRRNDLRPRSLRPHELEREAIALAALAGLLRRLRRGVPVAGVVGVAEEVALLCQLEAGLLHFLLDHVLVDAVQRLGGGEPAARLGAGVDDHVRAARLERVEDDLVHAHAVHRHVGDVVVDDVEDHQIQAADAGRDRVVEGNVGPDHVLHRRMREALRERVLQERHPARVVLHVDHAARRHGARQELGGVAAARAHVLHLHARPHAEEFEHLGRLAAGVELAVGGVAVGRGHHRGGPSRFRWSGGGGSRGRRRLARGSAGEEQGETLHGLVLSRGTRSTIPACSASPRSCGSAGSRGAAAPRDASLVRGVLQERRLCAALFVRARTIGARGRLRAAGARRWPGCARARPLLRARAAPARAARSPWHRPRPLLAARAARGLRRDARPPAAQRLLGRRGQPLLLLRLSGGRRGGRARPGRDRARAAPGRSIARSTCSTASTRWPASPRRSSASRRTARWWSSSAPSTRSQAA